MDFNPESMAPHSINKNKSIIVQEIIKELTRSYEDEVYPCIVLNYVNVW